MSESSSEPGLDMAPVDAEGLHAQMLLTEIRAAMFGREERLTIGRFELRELLGHGAHGSVYLADDTRLRRRVAVKVLRRESDPTARDRLLREAQALARLGHPNVLTVYDAGVEDSRVYIAMEYVEGGTLARWCRDHPPGPRGRFGALLQLGVGMAEGLAAAHRAGIIHRDVKPANVLVGRDGRPRIADFGVARADSGVEVDLQHTTGHDDPSITPRLTRTGAMVGTPAYAAPEQLRGRSDEATDQWSLCATLWEAGYGERAFVGQSMVGLLEAIEAGPPTPPAARAEVPRWWREILARGLAPDPKDRWPSVEALGEALRRGAARRRRKLVAGFGGAAVVVGLLSAGGWQAVREHRRQRCDADARSIADTWGADQQQRLTDALVATGLGYAQTTATRTADRLDAYADEWSALYRGRCLAHGLDATLSDPEWAATRACLGRRRDELGTLVDTLVDTIDAGVVQEAIAATTTLGPIDRCADESWLAHSDSAGDVATEAVREQLWRAGALDAIGKYEEGWVVAREALDAMPPTASPRLRSQVHQIAGRLAWASGNLDEAQTLLGEGFDIALAGGEGLFAAAAAIRLAYVVGYQLRRHDEGLVWGRVAAGLVAHYGDAAGRDEANLEQVLGAVKLASADYVGAQQSFERALALREEVFGSDHPGVAAAREGLGLVEMSRGRYAAAARQYAQVIAVMTAVYGPDHPWVARSRGNLASAYESEGRLDDAAREIAAAVEIAEHSLGARTSTYSHVYGQQSMVFEKQGRLPEAETALLTAIESAEAVFGPVHPRVAGAHSNLGRVYRLQGRFAEARAQIEQALEDFESTVGPEHPATANALISLALLDVDEGRYEAAEQNYRRALDIFNGVFDQPHADVAEIHGLLGVVYQATERPRSALASYDEAIAVAERVLSSDDPGRPSAMAWLWEGRAEVRLQLEQPGEAVRDARRALALHGEEASSTELARARFALARGLWPDESERPSARVLAEQAQLGYREGGDDDRDELRVVEAWLESHALG